MTEPFWQVRVDCWYALKTKNKRVVRHFLVQADSGETAMKSAQEHAERTATFGPKWIGFEHRSAAKRTLPLELSPETP